MLALLCAPLSASARCARLGPGDGVLLVCPQNCFMEARPVRPDAPPHYPLPPDTADSGTLAAGPLAVAGSSEIIDPMNAWLREAAAAGARTYAALDYHPPEHCSFCKPMRCDGYEGPGEGACRSVVSGTACMRSSFTDANAWFEPDDRCVDAVSLADYSFGTYYQWASHCVAGTFGARLDPYLDRALMNGTTFETHDSFSTFDGGRVSAAPPGTHDAAPTSHDALEPADVDLSGTLAAHGVTRLFVMGLATDFVVGNTILDALGRNPRTGTVAAPPSLGHTGAPPRACRPRAKYSVSGPAESRAAAPGSTASCRCQSATG